MRLEILKSGHRPIQKLLLGVLGLVAGGKPGPVLTMSYRREFFGAGFAQLIQKAMRGPSEWTVAEREIFAAFVSRLNQCEY